MKSIFFALRRCSSRPRPPLAGTKVDGRRARDGESASQCAAGTAGRDSSSTVGVRSLGLRSRIRACHRPPGRASAAPVALYDGQNRAACATWRTRSSSRDVVRVVIDL